MWFKRAFFGYCAALSAVTAVTASTAKDAFALHPHGIVEVHILPSLERRQGAFGNQTTVVETVDPVPTTKTTSNTLTPSDISHVSTTIATSTTIVTRESTSLDPTSSTVVPSSTPFEPSSTDGGVSSTSTLASAESTMPKSSTTDQQPSATPITSLRSESSDVVTSSSTFQVTSLISSSVYSSASSGVVALPSSMSEIVQQPTPTTSEIVVSSQETESSTSAAETSQSSTDIATVSTSESLTLSSTIEATSSISLIITSQTLVTESSTAAISTASIPAPVPPPTESSEPLPATSLSSSPSPSSSLEQTPLPDPTSSPSSSDAAQVSTSSTIIDTASSAQTSVPLLTTPEPAPSSSSSAEVVSSVTETMASSSSILTTESTPLTSETQPPSPSAEQSMSSTLIQPTPEPTVSSSSGEMSSSSSFGVTSSFEFTTEVASSSVTPEVSILPTTSTTQMEPSLSITSSILSSMVLSETGALPSEPNPTSLSVVSSESIGVTSSLVTSQTSISVGPTGTGIMSSVRSESDFMSSLVPSETLSVSPSISNLPASTILSSVSELTSSLVSQSDFSGLSSFPTTTMEASTASVATSGSQAISTQSTSLVDVVPTNGTFSSILSETSSLLASLTSGSQVQSSDKSTLVSSPTFNTSAAGSIPTSETVVSGTTPQSLSSASLAIPTFTGFSSFASTGVSVTASPTETSVASMNTLNGTQTLPLRSSSGLITATFSTIYVSSMRSSALDLSTVMFSLFSTVTGAAVNQTVIPTSSSKPSSETSLIRIPASETLSASIRFGQGANSTSPSPMQSSSAAVPGPSGSLNSTRITSAEAGITFSRSVLPSGSNAGISFGLTATEAETLQTTSVPNAVNSTTTGVFPSVTSDGASGGRSVRSSSMPTPEIDHASTTTGAGKEDTGTAAKSHTPTASASETAAAGTPPPLTTSQTAGVAVGATTGLLIAVVAAVFLARRYHAAKHGKRLSTGSIYPKVAYLYDPKSGGDGGDAEALMSGGTGGQPPSGSTSRSTRASPKFMQRASMSAIPVTRFTSPGNPFRDSVRDPAVHRYSEYARLDTAQALSAAVAGYGAASRHSSSYTKHPSASSNPFSDHVIPSPTFAPFSPDDIRRPELKRSPNANDERGEYAQMSNDSYAYLNTAASMYPPISPYGRTSAQRPSSYDARRQTQDSDPFADPFEHDLLLQVDERNRTSDSVTIFAPSPNLMTPRTPRTPVGPKLPVRQPNGMTSARSLLSPVAAKYMHKAQEVKIPRKSVASPVLVQVGRSPVIKPFSPPPAAPEPRGWDDIKRQSEKHFSDEQSVPAPLKFAPMVIKKKPVPTSHTRTKPSLTGAGQALLAGNGLPLTVNIPHMYNKSVGLDVPKIHAPNPGQDDMSQDPIVREKRSRELRFADPTLIGKDF